MSPIFAKIPSNQRIYCKPSKSNCFHEILRYDLTKYFDELISRKISNSKNAAIHPSSSMSEKQFDEKKTSKSHFTRHFLSIKRKKLDVLYNLTKYL